MLACGWPWCEVGNSGLMWTSASYQPLQLHQSLCLEIKIIEQDDNNNNNNNNNKHRKKNKHTHTKNNYYYICIHITNTQFVKLWKAAAFYDATTLGLYYWHGSNVTRQCMIPAGIVRMRACMTAYEYKCNPCAHTRVYISQSRSLVVY